MEQDPTDPAVWRLRIILTDGLAKFRADNDWAVNWGAGDFPSGIGTQDGAEIPIPAGEYKVTFNSTTGAYSFEELIIFSSVGLVGTATPTMEWNTNDVQMTKDLVDESFWFIPTVDLFTGEAKFRAENAWTVNWGNPAFPDRYRYPGRHEYSGHSRHLPCYPQHCHRRIRIYGTVFHH
ncbi:MAG: hypothetical protein IPL27_23005 [Lewinellaceae bacterium]|nr:hypothetical protein [Lewinellaceae bacterium]